MSDRPLHAALPRLRDRQGSAMVLVLLFGGICSTIETAAIAVVYTLVIETFVYKDRKAIKRFVGPQKWVTPYYSDFLERIK